MFKAQVIKRNGIQSGAVADTNIIKASITEDLAQKASSSVTCFSIPTIVQPNDIIRIYDTKGKFMYLGVINGISDKTIKCSQYQALFNDNFLIKLASTQSKKDWYANNTISTILYTYLNYRIMGNDSTMPTHIDKDVKNNFVGITAASIDSGTERLPYPTENNVVNLESYIYDIFNNYNRIIVPRWTNYEITTLQTEDLQNDILTEDEANTIDIIVPKTIDQQSIKLTVCNPEGIIDLGNNDILDFNYKYLFDKYENITNLNIVKQDEDTNTIYIYNDDGTTLRGAFCVDVNGEVQQINSDSPVPNRLGANKIKYVFDSNNNINDLARSGLPTLQYNHKISFDISFDDNNKFDDYILAKKIKFFENKTNLLYDTILTARKFEIEENSDVIKKAQFTLGKVRTSLTSVLNKKGV